MSSSASGPRGSFFADADAAQRALAMALPMIEPLVADTRLRGSGFLHIVVMNPGLTPNDGSFDAAVLLERSVGDRSKWDADYAAFARAKARLAWTHQQGGQAVQSLMPHRLREGDTLLAGGVYLDGIAVGVSGAQAWYDEAVATTIAACLRAVARERWSEATAQGGLFAER